MKKIFPLILIITSLIALCIPSDCNAQDGEKLFYFEAEQTAEYNYEIYVDLFTLDRGVKFIEVDLLDADREKLISCMASLHTRDHKLYMIYKDKETEIKKENIRFLFEPTLGKVTYPAIKVKLLDQNFSVIESQQTEFYN